jgi:hypothetical protein
MGWSTFYFSLNAGIAQLVEHNLAKVGVAGSSPVSRSEWECRERETGDDRALVAAIISRFLTLICCRRRGGETG